MISLSTVDDFLSSRALAVVGVSRSGKKIGNMIRRELQANGYRVVGVNCRVGESPGDAGASTKTVPAKNGDVSLVLYPSLGAVPEPVDGVVVVVPPLEAEGVVREAALLGIRRIWLQQGAASDAAIRFCEKNGLACVHGHCILMFLEKGPFFHRLHRWIWKAVGKYPR